MAVVVAQAIESTRSSIVWLIIMLRTIVLLSMIIVGSPEYITNRITPINGNVGPFSMYRYNLLDTSIYDWVRLLRALSGQRSNANDVFSASLPYSPVR